MQVLFTRCAGLDVHKKTIVACVLLGPADATPTRETRTFATTTPDVLALADWLSSNGVTHAAIESTGPFWKPIYNLLEANFEVWLLNAQHVKNLPGRKTDVRDAEWLAELLRHGLVKPSFVPPKQQRDLRELVRERTNFVRSRATLVNRVQKVLESANIKLASVVSDVLGASSRAMLDKLLAGEEDTTTLAELAKGRLRAKRELLKPALQGELRSTQRFLLRELLAQIDNLSATIERFDEQIKAAVAEDEEVIELLETIPGVGRATAEVIVAEIGTDMSRFASAAHLAAWAGLTPGNNQSGGKDRAARSRHGDTWLKSGLVQAAHGAAHVKDCYLAAQYRHLAGRRGAKRAAGAVAHSIIVISYHIIKERVPYDDLGGDYFAKRNPEAKSRYLKRQLEKLGYQVKLTPLDEAA